MKYCFSNLQTANKLRNHLSSLVFCLFLLTLIHDNDAYAQSYYGLPLTTDGLSNTDLSYPGSKAGIRFRAKYSGTFDGIKVYLSLATYENCVSCRNRCTPERCYAAGTGGKLLIELVEDGGPSTHFPTTKVLSTALVPDPLRADPSPPYYGSDTGIAAFRVITHFVPAVNLVAGEIYHLVFTNRDADPERNYISLNNLYLAANKPNMQLHIPDTDLASLYYWHPGIGWEVRFFNTPVYEIHYADGRIQGQGYVGSRIGSAKRIEGASKAREVYAVTQQDRLIQKVHIRLSKVGNPQLLTLSLFRTSGETLLSKCTISGSSFTSTNYSWASCSLPSPITLSSGQSYYMLIEGTGSANDYFIINPIQKGVGGYGFSLSSIFPDSSVEYNPGTGWLRDQIPDWGGAQAFNFPIYYDLFIDSPPSAPMSLRLRQ